MNYRLVSCFIESHFKNLYMQAKVHKLNMKILISYVYIDSINNKLFSSAKSFSWFMLFYCIFLKSILYDPEYRSV